MKLSTFKLLEALTSGHELTAAELDNLLTDQVVEDLYLEYKHGDELKKPKKARDTVRQYTSGFANSDGGILVIGVDEAEWKVTGASSPGGGDLARWASTCLQHMASHFSPVPRFYVIDHPEGNVLVVVTARSLGVVPCLEDGRIIYYFRIHDQTLKAPEYLVSDILLGRRRQPHLQVTEFSLKDISTTRDTGSNTHDLVFLPVFKVENQGLLRARNVRVGIVSLDKSPWNNKQLLSTYLLSFVNLGGQSIEECSHKVTSVADIEPFSVSFFKGFGGFQIPLATNHGWKTPYCWKAALYVTAEDSSPTWYQLRLWVNDGLLELQRRNSHSLLEIPHGSQFNEIERLIDSRPTVSIESVNNSP